MTDCKHHLIIKLFLIILGMIVTATILGSCEAADLTTAQSISSEPNLSGDWYIRYEIPESTTYSLILIVKTDGETIADQNVDISPNGYPESRLEDGLIQDTLMKFRWVYQYGRSDGKPGLILWNREFEGHYTIDETGDVVYSGTLLGTEIDHDCEYPIGDTTTVNTSPNKKCIHHQITGTWSAKRDSPF